MPLDVYKENIVPRLFLRRPGFDLREVDVVLPERFKDLVKCSDTILDRKDHRGLVGTGWPSHFTGENKEPGQVFLPVSDIAFQDRHLVQLRGQLTGNGGRSRHLGAQGDSFRCAPGVLEFSFAQVPLEPLSTLPQGLWMGINCPDVIQGGLFR